MQVRNRFARVRPVVYHQAVSGLFQSGFFCHFDGFQQEMPQRLAIFGSGVGDAWNRLLGHDQDVGWRLRSDVAHGQHHVVFIDNVCRDFAGDNFFEQGSAHGNLAGQDPR